MDFRWEVSAKIQFLLAAERRQRLIHSEYYLPHPSPSDTKHMCTVCVNALSKKPICVLYIDLMKKNRNEILALAVCVYMWKERVISIYMNLNEIVSPFRLSIHVLQCDTVNGANKEWQYTFFRLHLLFSRLITIYRSTVANFSPVLVSSIVAKLPGLILRTKMCHRALLKAQ